MSINTGTIYIIIAAEALCIAVLLFFVIRLNREYKRWKSEQSDAARRQQDNELDRALANERKR